MKQVTKILLIQVGILLAGSHDVWAGQQEESNHTIVPGESIGDYTLGMSKDDVLKKLGEPQKIHLGGEDYTLDNLPKRYYMFYDDISFYLDEDVVTGIATHHSRYKFANGLGVGDSRDRIIQTFGSNFELEEHESMDALIYEAKGLRFEIDKKSRTVEEIGVSRSLSIEPFDDVRAKDLRQFDLSSRNGLIATLTFNQETVWPERSKMPTGSDPEKILTNSMNPGLGIRELHKQGITGKGVNIAIIDQPLFKDHPDYNGKIVVYYDTGCDTDESSMHGPAVTSLLVGTHCGTAPDARVYYVAVPSWKADTAYYAKGLEWITAQNEKLPEADKIRVVSVSAAPSGPGSPFKENREMWDRACARAEADGIMVLDCTNSPRGFISRGWYNPGDPENVSKFNLGPPPKRAFKVDPVEMRLYVPSSCRTTAQHYDYHGRNSYIYWARGGLSWTIPYCAGVLAMGWQICPDLTSAQMKELLFASAYVHESGAKIIHPAAFIDMVRKQSENQPAQKYTRTSSETLTIVLGVEVGDYTLGMSKDDVLKNLGKPKKIHLGGEDCTMDNLPKRYFMFYDDISFYLDEDTVTGIATHHPRYKFANGLKVGDSRDRIKQAFGSNFELEEHERMDTLIYEEKGLRFEIDKKSGTIKEIGISQPENNRGHRPKPKIDGHHELMAFEDVRGKDLRVCDLRDSGDILDTLEFNQETLWPPPERLPKGFDPKTLLQEGMNPGLGVRDLHAQGITGAGVHVGLIDQPLLLDHPEYAGKIVSYYALDCGPHKSSGHGPDMASQLVGKRCGTAPGAKLHVVAVPSWKADASYYARALDRFVAYNESVPKEQKIRVVSVSCQPSGEGSVYKNQSLWDEAVQRAQDKGILVLDCTWHHGFVSLCWLDPENCESVEACTPGFRNGVVEIDEGHIHVPSAPRTTAEADEDGSFGYAYDGGGRRSRRPKAKNGYSDTIPYAAGVLALGWQIRPDLTPAQMKELLFASAHIQKKGAKIINPEAFIELIRKSKVTIETHRRIYKLSLGHERS
jgi:subtilisin family serine protease